ncbi:3'-5' exonuclease [Rhododendron vialii]|uniref:3'-5' exonuclease n=1 Tax=Rhododendron vialii TaxID=182163 RepID=UPI00265E2516|nr:3'-5' exonuclease [Rhododendron vialii]
MESGGNYSISDWDRPFTDLELEAIEAAFQSAATPGTTSSSSSSPIKRRRHLPTPNDDSLLVRRRLPGSINGAHSSSLLPCRNKQFFNPYHHPSYPAKLEMRYPAMAFKGQVLYSRTVAEVEKAAKELLKIVETRKREVDQVILGLDIEWRPIFRSGVPPRKVAVMQICGDPCHCYVMHIFHSGIPQSLRSLLEDPTSVKVGVGIASDAGKVYKDYNISMKALEDLSRLANQKFGGVPKMWSMASLTEKLICKQLPKPGKIRLGNWEADSLSIEQLQYAATDAFTSWYLYQSLKTLPDATDDRTEEIADRKKKKKELKKLGNVPNND